MDRIYKLARTNLSVTVATIFRDLKEAHRIRTETGRIETLPRDRLEDMGIVPRSEDNQRHSGQYGPLPQTQLW